MKNSAKNDVLFYESRKYTIGFNEIVSSKQITLFGFQKRKCRFPQEITSNFSYPLGVYTENFCLMECRIKIAIQMCGCRPFFYRFGNHNSVYPHQYCVFLYFIICWLFIEQFQIMDQFVMYPECNYNFYSYESFLSEMILFLKIWLNSRRICLAKNDWSKYWANCTCLPLCDSVDYSIVGTPSVEATGSTRMFVINTYVNKSRVKRDLLFSIDFLVGK